MRLFFYHLREQFMSNQSRWWLWYPVFFATGIGLYFSLPQEPSKWLTLGVIESLIILAIFFRHHIRVLYFLFILGLISLGFACIQLRTIYFSTKQAPVPSEKMYLQARIKYLDYNSKGNTRLTIDKLYDFDGNFVPGTFRISLRGKNHNLSIGQCVEMVAKLLPNPKASLPGGYQFDRKSFFLGLSGSGYAESRVLPIPCPNEPTWQEKLNFWKEKQRTAIINHIKSILPPNEAAITSAIIAGEQGGINQNLINSYRDSGLAHFLSISGLHMSMITGLMFFLVRFLIALFPPLALRWNSKKIAAIFALVISFVYLQISGSAIPAQRAFIMTFIVLLGVLLDRRAISMNTIALAAILVLLFSPEALIGASFQMSFAAVIALIAFYEKNAVSLQRFFDTSANQNIILRTIKIILVYIAGILVSDLVASLATLPFSIYHFNQISAYTTLANLLAGPIIGILIMPFTLLSLLLMPFGLDYYAIKVVGFGIAVVNDITVYVSSLPSAAYRVLSMPFWGFIFIIFGGLWLCIWQGKIRRWGLLMILIGLLSMINIRKPDILINAEGDMIAVLDNSENMIILPHRGDSFTKKIWLDKTASTEINKKQKKILKDIIQGKKTDKTWINLECDKNNCYYKQKFITNKKDKHQIQNTLLKPEQGEGMVIYLPNKIISVRDKIGFRPWNLNKI